MLATVRFLGNLAASSIAGTLWTALSPTTAFACLTAGWMVLAPGGLLIASWRS
ncbi:hypothetical protein [Streptomyces sp. NPDC102282]|uniref:hypothetical protein n=1 Tax=Streptomyces sp. NPDC102282 TaxID=3366154 RepID=UPI0037F4A668